MPSGEPDAAVDVVAFGETMASFRPIDGGPMRMGGAYRLTCAGAESTVAIGLARLGHAARWVGRVGDDEAGELVRRNLRAEGVDVDFAVVDPERPTGLMIVEQRTADVVRVDYRRAGSAGSRLCVDDLLPALSPAPAVLHCTGITPALGPAPQAAFLHAIQAASRAGTVVCLDVNYRARLWSREAASDVLRRIVPHVDVLVASEDELPLVDDRVENLFARGVGEVVVKRGAKGATAYTPDEKATVPAGRVTVRDVVGAGDAFVAGYLCGRLDGLDLAGRTCRGVAVATVAVGSAGDWEGLPTRDELAYVDMSPGATLR
ncbi:MAG: sugar kinase [Stackebrandtia sp.]